MEWFTLDRRVEFCETDAAGMVHFSSFCQYMEQAEHAFLRSLGQSVFPRVEHGTVGLDSLITWPRVRIEVDFSAPAYFEQILQLKLCIGRLGETSVTYIVQIEGPSGLVAIGKSTSVCCRMLPSSAGIGKTLEKSSIPLALREAMSPFLETSRRE
jgi:acyl-CoA thioester hydrolase